MRPVPSVLRTAIALLAAVLAGAIAAPSVAVADHPIVPQRFRVDSGDRCQYGYTEGILSFRAVHPPELPAVDISGVVVDRPLVNEPSLCPDDRHYTVAYFYAWALDLQEVDREIRRVDNGVLDYRFTLGDDPAVQRIDRVTVQICRHPLIATGPIYCGKPQTLWPNRITPQG